MATHTCRDCGTEVSKSAKVCPKCGADDPSTSKGVRGCMFTFQAIIGIAVVLWVLSVCGQIDLPDFDTSPATTRTTRATTTRAPTTTTTGNILDEYNKRVMPLLEELGGTPERARQLAFDMCDLIIIDGLQPAGMVELLVESSETDRQYVLFGQLTRLGIETFCPQEIRPFDGVLPPLTN